MMMTTYEISFEDKDKYPLLWAINDDFTYNPKSKAISVRDVNKVPLIKQSKLFDYPNFAEFRDLINEYNEQTDPCIELDSYYEYGEKYNRIEVSSYRKLTDEEKKEFIQLKKQTKQKQKEANEIYRQRQIDAAKKILQEAGEL